MENDLSQNIYLTIFDPVHEFRSTVVVSSFNDVKHMAAFLFEKFGAKSAVTIGTSYEESELVFITGDIENE